MTTSDEIWSLALQEAYASAPSDVIILYTLELRHPSFVDTQGNLSPIRLVRDFGVLLEEGDPDIYGYELTLEGDAPANAGQTVKFVSCMFDFELPSQQEGSLPTIEIIIDNVTKEVGKYLDSVVELDSNIEITYREYIINDLEVPQFILNGMSIQSIDSTVTRVTATASFADLINRNFPGKLYRPEEFRGLI
jgi:hypothetical protein